MQINQYIAEQYDSFQFLAKWWYIQPIPLWQNLNWNSNHCQVNTKGEEIPPTKGHLILTPCVLDNTWQAPFVALSQVPKNKDRNSTMRPIKGTVKTKIYTLKQLILQVTAKRLFPNIKCIYRFTRREDLIQVVFWNLKQNKLHMAVMITHFNSWSALIWIKSLYSKILKKIHKIGLTIWSHC